MPPSELPNSDTEKERLVEGDLLECVEKEDAEWVRRQREDDPTNESGFFSTSSIPASEDKAHQNMMRRYGDLEIDTWKTDSTYQESTIPDDDVLHRNLHSMMGSIKQLKERDSCEKGHDSENKKEKSPNPTPTPSTKIGTDEAREKSSIMDDRSSQASSKRQLDLATSLNPTGNKYRQCSDAADADEGTVHSTPLGMTPEPRAHAQTCLRDGRGRV